MSARPWLAAPGWLLVFGLAAPMAAAAADELVPYEVQAGDTLYGVSERLLQSASDWHLLARINRLSNPHLVTPGSRLMLPASRLRGVEQVAEVVYVRGSASTHADAAGGSAAKPLAAGDTLNEHTTVVVGPASFVTLRLRDGSVLYLQSDTVMSVQRLRETPRTTRRETVMQLDKGRVDSTVSPQPSGSRFDVRTPLAVTGVRGTRFGVSVAQDGKAVLADVVEGSVAVGMLPQAAARTDFRTTARAASRTPEAMLAAGQGAVVSGDSPSPQVRTLLAAPGLPAAGWVLGRLPSSLPVSAVEGARAYRLQIAEAGDATRVRLSVEAPLPLAVADLPDGPYAVRVRAIGGDGLMGAEAVATLRVKTTPVPPLAQSPAMAALTGPGRVELACTEVPGAVSYRLEVWRAGAAEPAIREDSAAGSCRFQIDATEPGEYRWRVATIARTAGASEDQGPFSDFSTFTVAPVPVAPEPAVETGDAVSLHWSGEPGERFELQVATDAAFSDVVSQLTLAEPRAQLELPSGCQAYFIRLKRHRADGLSSAFSAPRRVGIAGGVCTSDGAPVRTNDGSPLRFQAR